MGDTTVLYSTRVHYRSTRAMHNIYYVGTVQRRGIYGVTRALGTRYNTIRKGKGNNIKGYNKHCEIPKGAVRISILHISIPNNKII
jgi:hypothetical protein